MTIRCVVIDDEPLARRRIVDLLAGEPGIRLLAECGSATEALRTCERDRPDLIFLDVRMPGGDGFEMLRRASTGAPPHVIFVTGYEEFAARAFDVQAVDYLVKPFEDQRFREALSRARERIRSNHTATLHTEIRRLLDHESPDGDAHLLRFEERGREKSIDVRDICRIESSDNYVHVYHRHGADLLRGTLEGLLANLDVAGLVRIHRSHAIRRSWIESIGYAGKGRYTLRLRNGDVVMSSRSYRDTVQDLLDARPCNDR